MDAGKTIKLNFTRNNHDAIEDIYLTSQYYKTEKVTLGNHDIAQGQLKYGPSGNETNVPYNKPIEVFYDGTLINAASGITFTMLDNLGNYSLRVSKSVDKSKSLKIRYNRVVSNTWGSVTYDNEKTMTVQQWLTTPNQTLGRFKIIIQGFISYRYIYNNQYVYNYILYPNNLITSVGTLSGVQKHDNSYSKFTLTIPGTVNISYIRFGYNEGSYTYFRNRALADLEANSTVIMD